MRGFAPSGIFELLRALAVPSILGQALAASAAHRVEDRRRSMACLAVQGGFPFYYVRMSGSEGCVSTFRCSVRSGVSQSTAPRPYGDALPPPILSSRSRQPT